MNPFVIAFLLFLVSANSYLAYRFLTVFSGQLFVPNYVVCLIWFFLSIAIIVARNDVDFLPNELLDYVYIVGAYWLVIIYYATILTVFCDVVGVAQRLIGFEVFKQSAQTTAYGIMFVVAALLIYGSYNAKHPVVVSYGITINKPANVDKMRVVMISDTHFGRISGRQEAKVIVDKINELKPDVVVLCGDTIDSDLKSVQRKDTLALFKDIDSKFGVYAIMGNHEYLGSEGEREQQYFSSNGINVLIDKAVVLPNEVVLFGFDDYSQNANKHDFLQKAQEYNDKPLIILDHQPRRREVVEKIGADMLLCGHTHKGQIVPNNLITESIYELDYGYKKFGNLNMIVSCGVGTWGPPVRIGNQPEIVCIDIDFI